MCINNSTYKFLWTFWGLHSCTAHVCTVRTHTITADCKLSFISIGTIIFIENLPVFGGGSGLGSGAVSTLGGVGFSLGSGLASGLGSGLGSGVGVS